MQSEVFDQMMDERSENMREVDALCCDASSLTQAQAIIRQLRVLLPE